MIPLLTNPRNTQCINTINIHTKTVELFRKYRGLISVLFDQSKFGSQSWLKVYDPKIRNIRSFHWKFTTTNDRIVSVFYDKSKSLRIVYYKIKNRIISTNGLILFTNNRQLSHGDRILNMIVYLTFHERILYYPIQSFEPGNSFLSR